MLYIYTLNNKTMTVAQKATFVSVWDGGTEVRTNCLYDADTNTAFDIETADVNGLDILDEQFIELADGTEIRDFECED